MEYRFERLRVPTQVDEQEPFPFVHGDRLERKVRLVEAFGLLHVGRTDQSSVGRVGPGVIGTLNGLAEASPGFLADAGAPMAADVVEGPERPLAVAQDDDALASDRLEEVLARLPDLLGTADAEPPRLQQ